MSKSSRYCFRRSKRAADGGIAAAAAVPNGLMRAIRNALRIRCDGSFARYKGSTYVSMCKRVRSFRTNLGGTAGISPVPFLWGRSFLFFKQFMEVPYVYYDKTMAKE